MTGQSAPGAAGRHEVLRARKRTVLAKGNEPQSAAFVSGKNNI